MNILSILTETFEVYFVIIFSYLLCDVKQISFFDVTVSITYGLLTQITVLNNTHIILLIKILVLLLYISLHISKNFYSGIFSANVSIVITYLINYIVTLPVNAFLFKGSSHKYCALFCNILCVLICVFLAKIKFTRQILYRYNRLSSIYKLAIMYSCIFIFFSIMYICNGNILNSEEGFFLAALTVLLFISNLTLMFYDQKVSAEKEKLREYKNNYDIYGTLINDIRASQHEFSNKIQTIATLPSVYSTYDELSAALKNYSDIYLEKINYYPLLHINYPLLAAAMYNLSQQAEVGGKRLHFDICSKVLKSDIHETDLTDYSCILLQNAIEASKVGEKIYVKIDSQNNKYIFEVRNKVIRQYTIKELSDFFSRDYSSKANHSDHGYGLFYLNRQVTKNNGSITINCDELKGSFWISITLQI